QMRRSRAPIFLQRRGYFDNSEASESGADDHFTRELHTGGAQTNGANSITYKAPQTTMEITNRNGEKESPEKAKKRISQIPVQNRHRTGGNSARKAVAYD